MSEATTSPQRSPLAAIVCGFERGGTTLVSTLLKQHPSLDSAFEGGLLLAPTLAEFPTLEPYAEHLRTSWRIDDAKLRDICDAPDWLSAYARLAAVSPAIKSPDVALVDKTPRYLEHLPEVLAKVPDVPCIVLARDPLSVLHAWRKRLHMNPRRWFYEHLPASCERYLAYHRGYARALAAGMGPRILLVHYEALCTEPEREAERIFAHLGLTFDPALLALDRGGPLHANLHGSRISADYVAEYAGDLDFRTAGRILRLTREASGFVWEGRT